MPPRNPVFYRLIGASVGSVVLLTAAPRAAADDPSPDLARAGSVAPPAVNRPFVQYGVAFASEFVAEGTLCNPKPSVAPTCLLGSGAGLVFPRIGWRSPGHWYLGGAYEFSKHDAGTVYLLPILQQLRGEARYYFLEGNVGTPFVEGTLGLAGYGNEWTVDSYGPVASFAVGVEAQVSRNTVVGATFAYRLIHFSSFTDSGGNLRDAGFAQLVGLNVLLEVRDPY